MKLNNIAKIMTGISLVCLGTSCSKYLNIKPDKKLMIPSTVSALQGIIDNNSKMNRSGAEAGEIASDNYYLEEADFASFPLDCYRRAYLWQPGIFTGLPGNSNDWAFEYNVVYNANVVLDGLKNVSRTVSNGVDWDNCKGSALVFRAKAFYEIAQIWTKAYDSATATTDPGIPLRLTSDYNVPSRRSNVKETYDQIIKDLMEAAPLLPNLPTFPTRPSKCAAYCLLARTYLTMGDFAKAKLYADSSLQIKSDLMDFNTLNSTASYPVPRFNQEDILEGWCIGGYDIDEYYAKIDSNLYRSYDANDLRKTIFYYENDDSTIAFKGSYAHGDIRYNGVATDEIFLIRAESNARLGNVSAAMEDFNTLMKARWLTGSFVPLTATNAADALNKILTERRKELVMRMLRFTDIKRLNKMGANIVLKRIINGQTYTLPPNDPRYALPIPDDVIKITGMVQN